jgi:tRNA(Glu) U13 pseudouridine synthase TruD
VKGFGMLALVFLLSKCGCQDFDRLFTAWSFMLIKKFKNNEKKMRPTLVFGNRFPIRLRTAFFEFS